MSGLWRPVLYLCSSAASASGSPLSSPDLAMYWVFNQSKRWSSRVPTHVPSVLYTHATVGCVTTPVSEVCMISLTCTVCVPVGWISVWGLHGAVMIWTLSLNARFCTEVAHSDLGLTTPCLCKTESKWFLGCL